MFIIICNSVIFYMSIFIIFANITVLSTFQSMAKNETVIYKNILIPNRKKIKYFYDICV